MLKNPSKSTIKFIVKETNDALKSLNRTITDKERLLDESINTYINFTVDSKSTFPLLQLNTITENRSKVIPTYTYDKPIITMIDDESVEIVIPISIDIVSRLATKLKLLGVIFEAVDEATIEAHKLIGDNIYTLPLVYKLT